MACDFNVEKFELFAKIIFNIFPRINFVTLNNGKRGSKTNYYLRLHSNQPRQFYYKDNKYFEFLSDESHDISTELYLKDINYTPKTKGVYILNRQDKLEPYVFDAFSLSVKLLPLMEFCNFHSYHYFSHRSTFIFKSRNITFNIGCYDVHYNLNSFLDKDYMKLFAAIALNGE